MARIFYAHANVCIGKDLIEFVLDRSGIEKVAAQIVEQKFYVDFPPSCLNVQEVNYFLQYMNTIAFNIYNI